MILGIYFFVGGMLITSLIPKASIFLSQLLFVIIPTVFLTLKYKDNLNFKEFVGFNPVSFKTILTSALMPILFYPLMVFINGICVSILPEMPDEISNIELMSSYNLPFLIINVAIIPGIFEEILFRGFFIRAFNEKKPTSCIMYVAFLFALFHFNPYNFVGPFMLGLLFGFFVYWTGSIVPSIIGHSVNNIIAISISQIIINAGMSETEATELLSEFNINPIFIIAGFILSVILLCLLIKVFIKENENNNLFVKYKVPSALEFQEKNYEEAFEEKKNREKNNISHAFLLVPIQLYMLIIISIFAINYLK